LLQIGYLKLWQLTRPELDQYNAIFIDEAQDCTPGKKNIVCQIPPALGYLRLH